MSGSRSYYKIAPIWLEVVQIALWCRRCASTLYTALFGPTGNSSAKFALEYITVIG
jgi:hypothetical protein